MGVESGAGAHDGVMSILRTARFGLGQIVRHRDHPLQGVVVDADAVCAGPCDGQVAPDQPFYQVFIYGQDGGFIAYVPEESLLPDETVKPLSRSEQAQWFTLDAAGRHAPRSQPIH